MALELIKGKPYNKIPESAITTGGLIGDAQGACELPSLRRGERETLGAIVTQQRGSERLDRTRGGIGFAGHKIRRKLWKRRKRKRGNFLKSQSIPMHQSEKGGATGKHRFARKC